jgi:predicted ATPase
MAHQNEEGLLILDEALEVAHRNGERYYEAELYRLKGEVLLGHAARRGFARSSTGGNVVIEAEPTAVVQAEACFNQSLKTAQEQNAKSWELRAVMSLASLLQKRAERKRPCECSKRPMTGSQKGLTHLT